MSLRVIILAYRKPGLSPDEFKRYYEAHVDLVKSLSVDDFPVSHKRSYIARATVETTTDDASPRNTNTPATLLMGRQSDFDFDAVAELTFVNQQAFEAFTDKVYEPDNAALIAADEEKFLDRSKLSIALLGDMNETMK